MVSLVTNSGFSDLMAAWAAAEPYYLQYGEGSGQDATSTTLASASQDRVAGTVSQETVSVSGDTMRVTGTITSDGVRTITEVGLFTDSDGASMFAYGDFSGISLEAGDAIAFSVNITVAQG